MVDSTYQPKVYRKDGGDTQVVASGGVIAIETGGDLTVNGVSLIDEVAALSGLDSGELGVLNGVTAGTVTASKALVVDANKDLATIRHLTISGNFVTGSTTLSEAELAVLDSLTSTQAEIIRATDVSARIVVITASLSITEALHEGKTCVLREAGGNALVTCTMPAATGGGGRYRFVVDEVNTSNYVIKSVAGADIMRGTLIGASTTDSATDAARTWTAGATDDTITLNGTTTGGVTRGDWIELEDIAADGWAVRGVITQSGAEATPFSDTVA